MGNEIKVAQYFWGSLDAGGAETFIVNLFQRIDKNKFDFEFIVYEDKEYFYTNKIKSSNGTIHSLCSKDPLKDWLPVRLVKRWYKLYQLLKREEYQVFHCNCDFSFKFVEMYLAKKAGVPIRICHSHNSGLESTTIKKRIKIRLHQKFIPLLNKFTTHRLACSQEAGEWLFGSKRNDILIIHNAIDTEKYIYTEEKHLTEKKMLGMENDLIIGHIGRFFPVKNHDFLIDIFYEIYKKRNCAKLILVGEGEEKRKIQNKVNKLGLESAVLFVGVTHNIVQLLLAMDVFVMPSFFEGLPVAAVEAQASGLPCVFSENISRMIAISNHVKFVSLEKTAEEWADIILDSSELKRENTYKVMCENGYDISVCAKQMEKIYGSNII